MNLKIAKKGLLNCSLCPIMTYVELRKQRISFSLNRNMKAWTRLHIITYGIKTKS